jgi:lipopolysaccharide transport system ATP-binding protein
MVPIIQCRELSKRYQLGVMGHETDTFREFLLQLARAPFAFVGAKKDAQDIEGRNKEFLWALRDINFDVEEGSVVGVIGGNGAGKSTLLKILSRITDPTEGEIIIRGRLASLLEVGTGFHPELTGRENVFLNGAILGMHRSEIAAKFDEIVAFSEIEQFLDTPVKRYSSGMYVRLAFSVAAHLDPEILVVDEVLAVGDVAFQKKCIGKMSDVSHSGRTVLFVSHNMAVVQNLCTTGMVLDHGRINFQGSVQDAINNYLNVVMHHTHDQGSSSFDLESASREGMKTRRRRLKRLDLLTADDQPLSGGLPVGAPLKIAIEFEVERLAKDFDMTVSFETLFGHTVLTTSTMFEPEPVVIERVGLQCLVLEIPSLTLMPGEYRVKILFKSRGIRVDRVNDAARLSVVSGDYYGSGKMPDSGAFVIDHRWRLK